MARDQASSQTQPVEDKAAENLGSRTASTGNVSDYAFLTNAAGHAGRAASVTGDRITITGDDKVTGYTVTLEPAPGQGGLRVVEVKGPDGKPTQRQGIYEIDGVIPLDTVAADLRREEVEKRNAKIAEEAAKDTKAKADAAAKVAAKAEKAEPGAVPEHPSRR